MARVTIEDCISIIPNRFELVMLAAQRARALSLGAVSLIKEHHKDAVLALREIAHGFVSRQELQEALIKKCQLSVVALEDFGEARRGSAEYERDNDKFRSELKEMEELIAEIAGNNTEENEKKHDASSKVEKEEKVVERKSGTGDSAIFSSYEYQDSEDGE